MGKPDSITRSGALQTLRRSCSEVMILRDQLIARRSFVKGVTPFLAFGLRTTKADEPFARAGCSAGINEAELRGQLLELINIERALAGAAAVTLDELACEVASRHALDMVTGKFLSHWGSDGLKPYQRYSFAGGTDYSAENVSATDQILSLKPDRVAAELINMNIRMHAETPPNDGHRRAILGPEATHVGLGMALKGNSLRLAEMFLARYAEIDRLARESKPGSKLVIKGKLLNKDHIFQHADVYYEPLPVLNGARLAGHRYSLPTEFVTLRPILFPRMRYSDGTTGTIDVGSHGHFQVPVTLFKRQAGIYTVVIWIKKKQKEQAFPVTEICIRAD